MFILSCQTNKSQKLISLTLAFLRYLCDELCLSALEHIASVHDQILLPVFVHRYSIFMRASCINIFPKTSSLLKPLTDQSSQEWTLAVPFQICSNRFGWLHK